MFVNILTSPLAFLVITLGLILSLYTWASERVAEHSADSSLSPETRATINAYLDKMGTDECLNPQTLTTSLEVFPLN